jgi:hypothetical protein
MAPNSPSPFVEIPGCAAQEPGQRLAGPVARFGRFLRALGRPAPKGSLALADALPWLVPKVRPRFVYETFTMRTGRPAPVFRPLAGALAVSLVVDLPNQDLDVGPAELDAWQVDFDRLMQTARSNLLARGGDRAFQSLGHGRYRSSWRDSLDGSRMLLPGLLKRLPLQGDPVVLVPNRNTLLVVGADDLPGLRWALECTSRDMNEDLAAVEGSPLRLRNYHWEAFRAGEDHPLGALLGRIEQLRLKNDYAQQKALLDECHRWRGAAVTVAPYHLETLPAGAVSSFTVWSHAAQEVWLPEADRINLAWAPGAPQGRPWVSWQAAQQRLCHLLEPVGLFPERYRFRALPQADQLERLLA